MENPTKLLTLIETKEQVEIETKIILTSMINLGKIAKKPTMA